MKKYNNKKIEMSSVFDAMDEDNAVYALENNSEAHSCHYNAAQNAIELMDVNEDQIFYCEGYVCEGDYRIPHCWNMTSDGTYFDSTLEKNSGINKEYLLVRVYDYMEIEEIFDEEGKSFITFDKDGEMSQAILKKLG